MGAAISFFKGGGLYIKDSEFKLEYEDPEVRSALSAGSGLSLEQLEPYIERLFGQLMLDIKTTYKEQLPQKFLMSDAIFNDQISLIRNEGGQLYLKTSLKTILNDEQPVFAFGNIKLRDLILQEFEFELLETDFSAIKDSYFKNNAGS